MCVEGETRLPARGTRVVSFRGQMFGLRMCTLSRVDLAPLAFTGRPIGFARRLPPVGGL